MQLSERDMNRLNNIPNKIENVDMDDWKSDKENTESNFVGKKPPRRNGRNMGE